MDTGGDDGDKLVRLTMMTALRCDGLHQLRIRFDDGHLWRVVETRHFHARLLLSSLLSTTLFQVQITGIGSSTEFLSSKEMRK